LFQYVPAGIGRTFFDERLSAEAEHPPPIDGVLKEGSDVLGTGKAAFVRKIKNLKGKFNTDVCRHVFRAGGDSRG